MTNIFRPIIFAAIAILYPIDSYADSVDIALTLTEGITVGEDDFFGENAFFSENNTELGLSTIAYVTHDFYTIMMGVELTTSDKRDSQQFKLGVLRKFALNHQVSIYLQTMDASERYYFKDPVIDEKHRQALTNTEWGVFTKLKYQYYLQNVSFGFLASTKINSTQLIQDELSAIFVYKKSTFFAQIIAGKEQQQLTIGITLPM